MSPHYIDGSPIQREKLATVMGHLEGYADAMALPYPYNRNELLKALREDAATLAELLDIDGSLYLNGKEQ